MFEVLESKLLCGNHEDKRPLGNLFFHGGISLESKPCDEVETIGGNKFIRDINVLS